MKKQIFLMVSAAASLLLGFSAEAATISYNGQIEVVHPGIPNSSRGTVDYIWFTISTESLVSGTSCSFGTDDLGRLLYTADISARVIGSPVVGGTPFQFPSAGNCSNGAITLAAGGYVFVIKGDYSDWSLRDGIVPFDFDFTETNPSYSLNWTGDGLALESAWAGNLNGYFAVTIPEPSMLALLAGSIWFGLLHQRRNHVEVIPKHPAIHSRECLLLQDQRTRGTCS